MSSTDIGHLQHGERAAAISKLVVRLVSDYTGRGPTKARTYLNDGMVFVVLRDMLTTGEQSLVKDGKGKLVLNMRLAFQQTMREDLITGIEAITGQKVRAFLSANHMDPDIAIESFVLDPSTTATSTHN